MNRPSLQIAFAIAAVAIAGCASIQVSSETAPGVDLSNRVTYVWHSPAGRLPLDPRIDREAFDGDIRAQVDESLAALGFRPAAAGVPVDLMVAYRAFVKLKTDVGAVNDPVGFSTGWGAHRADQGFRADSGGTFATDWEQGRLDIELLDGDGTRVLWRGSAKTELDFSNPPKERQRRLRRAVARVIEQLPPR